MIKITNDSKIIETEKGDNLLEVLRSAGYIIDAPCGGSGHCGKCTVLVNNTAVLACKTVITGDMTVTLLETEEIFFQEIIEQFDSFYPSNPVIKKIETESSGATRNEYQPDIEYLKNLLRGQDLILKDVDTELLKKLPLLTHKDTTLTLYGIQNNNEFEMINIVDGKNLKSYGIAIDLGTTTVNIGLIDIDKGTIESGLNMYNEQSVYGADIIHRIIAAGKNDGLIKLQRVIINSIKRSVKTLAENNNIDLNEINTAVISGNTTMLHLFLGLPPRYIRETPYSPVTNVYPPIESKNIFNIIDSGKIFFIPGVSNYLGGDLVSGTASCELTEDDKIKVLLDIGTNGEIVIGSSEWLMGCACSAGPAFEGMGLNCGIRYRSGAVTGSEIINGAIKYYVSGNEKPAGICGTGIISIINNLLNLGMIDNRGKFTEKAEDEIDSAKAVILFNGKETFSGNPVYINEIDIDNIIRAKAAIMAGLKTLMKSLDLDFNSIDKFYITGGIGKSLNIDDAVKIGLLPDIKRDKFHLRGNSSLEGAVKFMLSLNFRNKVNSIASKITYFDLSRTPGYMDTYMESLFLPLTGRC